MIDTNFDSASGAQIPLGGDWDYLDAIENDNGGSDDYPVDGSGRDWNSTNFNQSTSTIGQWESHPLPIQAGGIDGFPSAPDVLDGIGTADNGQNLVTTYLFRKTFTLSTRQAAETDWSTRLLVDDGCVIYINGTEVLRNRLPSGQLTTQTLAQNSPTEGDYETLSLNVPGGLMVAGTNTIAIEVHQTQLTSSDSGLDLELLSGGGGGLEGGFVYLADLFGTSNPGFATGQHETTSGFNGTGALRAQSGGDTPNGSPASSAGWTRGFSLSSAASVELSLRYRLIADAGFENSEFIMAVAQIDGTSIGSAQNDALAYILGNGNGGGADDTGWRQATISLPLAAGQHTVSLGVYVNKSTVASEIADVYFDDVTLTASGSGASGGVLNNDSGSGTLTATLLSQPANGSVSMETNGTFTYTPDLDFAGNDSFTYRATDSTGNSTATVNITVAPINDAPTGVAQSYSTPEDQALSVGAVQGVLQGAQDVDNAPGQLTATLESDVGEGSLVLNPSGAFTYSPRANFNGSDSFTYRVSDGVAESEIHTTTLTVTAVDDAPVAAADSYTIEENNQLQVTVAQDGGGNNDVPLISAGAAWKYLDDGSDQGVGWIATTFSDSSWKTGIAQLGYGDEDETTVVEYGPDPNNKFATTYFRRTFNLPDADRFDGLALRLIRDDAAAVYLNGSEILRSNLVADAAYDTRAETSTGNENDWRDFDIDPELLATGVNIIAVEIHQHDPDSSDLSFDLSMTGALNQTRGVLANDSDPEGGNLIAAIESQPANGTVSLNPDGTFTYTPAANYFGEDSFQYRATDGNLSSVGTATVTVTPGPNDVPNANADVYAVLEDQTLSRNTATGVLANDDDPDGDPIQAQLISDVSNGSLSLDANGSFVYTPTADFFGSDAFIYRASDGLGTSADTAVSITVNGVNDAPSAKSDSFVVQPSQIFSGNVLANDSDADGDTLVAVLLGDVDSGSLNLNSNGSFTYNPENFRGTIFFYYEANDETSRSAEVQVALTVNGRPTVVPDGYSVSEDSILNVGEQLGVLANDSDADSSSIVAFLRSDVSNGTLQLSQNGSFSYTPDGDFSGTDAFTYVVGDGFQLSSPAVVTISVQAVNDAPVVADDDYGVITNTPFSASATDGVLNNDLDADGDNLTASIVTGVSSGALTLNPDGSFNYTPASNFEGDATFTYRASDATSSTTATATLHVGPDLNSIVINEIMYHPASDNDSEEYIEITNIGENLVDLSGWKIFDGVDYTFPARTIPPSGFLVIAADVSAFEAIHGAIGNVIGGWSGRLSNSGERVRLENIDGIEIDDVTYSDEGEWAARERIGSTRGWDWNSAHDGGGQSLELIFTGLSNKQGQNWSTSLGSPTPGTTNSIAANEIAPMILDVAHRPVVPRSSEPVSITAELRDIDGTTLSASLFWREAPTDPGAFNEVAMADDGTSGDGEAGDGIYGAILPAMPDSTVVEFYVSASDGALTRTWPNTTNIGQVANAHYQVDDEVHDADWPIYRIVMTADEDDEFVNVNRSSNERFHATLILDDCSGPVIRYNSSLRVRGAGSRSHNPPPMRVSVPHDRPWNKRTKMNWNTKYTYSQYIGMRLFQGSGLAAPDGKPMRLRWNGDDRMRDDAFDYGLAIHMEVLDGDFVSDKYPDDADGNLYKKVRPDREWAFRDGDVGDYMNDGWNKETNADENDWSDLNGWLDVMNNSDGDPDYIAQVEAVVDLDQWLDWFGAMAVLANGETNASNGADDDFTIYRGIVTPRFKFVPHDLDTILGDGDGSRITDPEHTIFDMISRGSVLDPLIPLFSDPGVQTRYYQALRELLQGSFAKDQFDELVVNSLSGWVPDGEIEDIIDFMDARRTYITGLVDAELGAAPPAPKGITSNTLASAHGSLMISEVLAVNRTLDYFGNFPDFVELYNSSANAVSIAGMTMTDDLAEPAKFTFPAGTSIAAGDRMILFADSADTDGRHLGFSLGSNGEAIYLVDGATTVDSVSFGLQIPDLSISRTGAGLNTWALTQPTPGTANIAQDLGDPDVLRINEWLTQPEVVFTRDFIELYNPSSLPVAIGGLAITDEPASDPTRFQLPALSFIPAGGFALFEAIGNDASPGNASELPFKLGSDQGWLAISGVNGVEIDEVHYLCHRLDVSQGRSSDGGASYADFALPTPGYSNATDLSNESAIIGGLRITELMYHPESGNLEYVELRNVGSVTFNLAGVSFSEGIQFSFPSMELQPGEYALVAQDQGAFEASYGGGLNVVGSYSGKLSNGGERMRLEIESLGAGILDFEYSDNWYPSTDGGGFALEIIDESAVPASWHLKDSWRAGSFTGGTPGSGGGDPAAYDTWITAQFGGPSAGQTGKLDDPDEDGAPNFLEFALGGNPQLSDPAAMVEFTDEGGYLTLTYNRAIGSIGLVELIPQISGDDANWNGGASLTVRELLSTAAGFETWKVRDATPIGIGDRRFIRIRASCTDG
ncbi:MAG: VCBS repeat-containing protein [Pseudoalteromonas tetraodonis]